MATLSTSSTTIGLVLDCKQKFDSRKVNVISLDGTPYVQTPSKAIDRRDVDVYCETRDLRNTLDKASNEGDILIVNGWLSQTIKGYIEKEIRWKEKNDGSGVGRFTLLVKEVVDE